MVITSDLSRSTSSERQALLVNSSIHLGDIVCSFVTTQPDYHTSQRLCLIARQNSASSLRADIISCAVSFLHISIMEKLSPSQHSWYWDEYRGLKKQISKRGLTKLFSPRVYKDRQKDNLNQNWHDDDSILFLHPAELFRFVTSYTNWSNALLVRT